MDRGLEGISLKTTTVVISLNRRHLLVTAGTPSNEDHGFMLEAIG